MVKRLLHLLHKEISGLHQAAYLLGFFALCSQFLALIRDRMLASNFGATNTLDLYYAAFRIPDMLFVTAASIVSISVIIPFLVERFEKSDAAAKEFLDDIFTFFFCFIVGVGLIAFITAPYILLLLFPSFIATGSFDTLVSLTRILLLSPIFLGFSNLLASITQIRKRFFVYAMSPVLYNIGIIFGIMFLYPLYGLVGLGWGVVIGACMHFAIQLPFVIRQGLLPSLSFPLRFNAIKRVIYTSIPRTLTVSSNEIAELFLISFASFLIPGSISIFNFSFNLQSVPFSIIGVSYSLAAFPTLSRFFSRGETGEFVQQMITTSKHIIFWSIPISIMFIVLRAQIVRTILGAGRFNWDDTRLTAAALAIFTISLIAQNLMTLFVRSYYARGKTRTPLIMNVISASGIIAISFGLVELFQHNQFFKDFVESLLKVQDISGSVVLMLPLGFTIGVILNVCMHWVDFSREFRTYSREVLSTLFQVLSASVIMGYVTYIMLNVFDGIFNVHTGLGIFMQGFVSGIVGICALVFVLFILGSVELRMVWQTLHRKIWKTEVVPPDAEL